MKHLEHKEVYNGVGRIWINMKI